MEDLKDGSILPEEFRKFLPGDVYELLIQISRQGFSLVLVGGSVRDYLLYNELSKDLDFELRHSFDYEEEEWIKMIHRLAKTLKEKHSHFVEVLGFEILKIKLGSFAIELSSPRIESYIGAPPYGHSEFEVELFPNLPYSESFKRRDFTINALGIEFGVPGSDDEFKLIDPYGGVGDLDKKILRPCSDDFYNDPVRFIRMIRFSERFDFEFDVEPSQFDLTEMSAHYFFQEGLKNFFPISRRFFEMVEVHNIQLAIDLQDLGFLKDQALGNFGPLTRDEVLLLLTFCEDAPELDKRAQFARVAGMKNSSAEDYQNLKDKLKKLSPLKEMTLKNLLRHHNFLELMENREMILISELHKIYNRHRFGDLEILKNVDEKAFETFVFFKGLFGEETKGKQVAAKLMDMVPKKESRSVLSVYCHLLVFFNLRPILPESRFGS